MFRPSRSLILDSGLEYHMRFHDGWGRGVEKLSNFEADRN